MAKRVKVEWLFQVDKKKIDGTIAMIQALGMYLRTPHYTNEILTI